MALLNKVHSVVCEVNSIVEPISYDERMSHIHTHILDERISSISLRSLARCDTRDQEVLLRLLVRHDHHNNLNKIRVYSMYFSRTNA